MTPNVGGQPYCSGATLLGASVGWPHARTIFLPGRDGADRALIAVALGENVEKHYASS